MRRPAPPKNRVRADCDLLRVRREHAYLVPAGAVLPLTPRGPVLRMR
ncbi:hypothetical protein [Kitasatospora paranensis]|uniref:Uncharacterized protein n=1 Tax=Kitasatospora paranensis TaxID=258053 RepID=A0ABW2FT74_9ACTN